MTDRKDKSKIIRHEVSKYLSKKGLSCHYEVGLNRWGKLRADVLAFNYKRHITIVEVKSSMADYKSDKKWQGYLPFSDSLYFAFDSDFPLNPEIVKELKAHGVGIMVVNLKSPLHLYRSHSIKVLAGAKTRNMDGPAKRDIIVRLAYRAGRLRTNKNSWMGDLKK
jgi:hypothetical protein